MPKRKKKQKKAPLTMKLAATIACGLYFWMIGNVMFSEPEKPRVKQVKIATVIAAQPVVLYNSAGVDVNKPLAKPAKLKEPKKPIDKAEQSAMTLLLYGTEEESKQAEIMLKRMNSMVVANKLMAKE